MLQLQNCPWLRGVGVLTAVREKGESFTVSIFYSVSHFATWKPAYIEETALFSLIFVSISS